MRISVTSLYLGFWDEAPATWMSIVDVDLVAVSLISFSFYYAYECEIFNEISFCTIHHSFFTVRFRGERYGMVRTHTQLTVKTNEPISIGL